MTPEERGQVLATARLLEAAGRLDLLSTGLTLLAAAALIFRTTRWASAIVAIALGLIAKLYSVRISFDARLLSDIAADKLTTMDLDHALVELALAPRDKAGRDWSMRCRGAKRLVVLCAAATIAQAIAMACV